MAAKSFVFMFADVEVREREFSLVKAGVVLPVEPKAFRVLLMLLRNPQKLITKEELLNAVWGDAAVTENSLARSIALLRRLLGDETRNPLYIETVATIGYRWVCKVEAAEDLSGVLEPIGEKPASSTNTNAVVAFPEEVNRGVGPESTSEYRKENARTRRTMRLAIVAAVLVAGLGAAVWYLHRPLSPPRITGYTRITNDGHKKFIAGTDGNRLYFTRFGPNSLNQIGIAGGEDAQIPAALPGLFWALDISPDGSNLLVTARETGKAENSSWIVRVLGGASRRIGNGDCATFSPDGNAITCVTSQGELRLIQTDGTGDHKLASIGPGAAFLHWSPDGKILRFMRDGVLWEILADGSDLHEVLPRWQYRGRECCGGWTADGKFYIFVTELRANLGGPIWALDERRGLFRHPSAEPVQLTSGPINWNAPVPGKGMNRIFSTGETLRGELYRFDPKTRQPQPFLGGISAQDVSFSKDGRSVAYVSFPDGGLWKANRDGSNPVQLSFPPVYATNPRWSPDSSKIVFGDYHETEADSVYLISSQGAGPQRLLPDDPGSLDDPDWSADGRKIVFASSAADGKGNNLAVLDLSTHQVAPVPGSEGMSSPRWSPDGKLIAATSGQGLKVLDFATQQWSPLLERMSMDYPAWSSDSKYIFFLFREGADPGVYRIRATGGKAERVVDLKDWHTTGQFGFWMALDPTDAPLLLHDEGSDDIYALTLEEK